MIKTLPLDSLSWTAQIDLQLPFLRLTLDSASEFPFGKLLNSQGSSLYQAATNPPIGDTVGEIPFEKAFDLCSEWKASRTRSE